jgi:hypothetical protein
MARQSNQIDRTRLDFIPNLAEVAVKEVVVLTMERQRAALRPSPVTMDSGDCVVNFLRLTTRGLSGNFLLHVR